MQREKVCAVLGLARAGIPAARFLANRGARVWGCDGKSRAELSEEALALESSGVELRLGETAFDGLEECSLIVLSPGLKIHHEPLRSIIEQCERAGVEIIGELELSARHCPAPMICVTGTKGKSTTVKLITEMLNAAGIDALRAGNTGIPLIAELPNLAPASWAVVEVSSFQLERAPTLKPRIAALLNLLPDHQDYHTSLQQYWDTKLKLFANQKAGDAAIFNIDDAQVNTVWAARSANPVAAETVATSALEAGEESVSRVALQNGALGFHGEAGFEPVIAIDEIPLRGAHNRGNVAAALAAVRAAVERHGLDWAQVREAAAQAIRDFESLPHRLEKVATVCGITYINDSQATIPDAALRALEAFEQPVTLIAGGLNKLDDPDGYNLLGEKIAERAHLLVTIGEAAPLLETAAKRAGFPAGKIVTAGNLTEAVKSATMGTPQGGTIVMSPACASFDQFKNYEERGQKFRDLVAALETSQSHVTPTA
ncbi:MAG TPA: UDP-N-acetylmuramoyl-L-alanine--D-glutamate ligase [Abditibacteriaceae bacterium]|jgi:UDP-N-acetylmuramoylalanine--D-glutamate ligase